MHAGLEFLELGDFDGLSTSMLREFQGLQMHGC